MSPKRKALELAAELGATVRHHCGPYGKEVAVEAPEGFHWAGSELHEIVANECDGGPMRLLWVSVIADMKHGLEPCGSSEECLDWSQEEPTQ